MNNSAKEKDNPRITRFLHESTPLFTGHIP